MTAKGLLRGTFLQRGNGFHFAVTPPEDVADRKHLRSDDVSQVIACVLANLQQGHFDVANVPIRLLQTTDAPGLWVACTALIGFAAPMADVRRFVEGMIAKTARARCYYICETAMSSGGLWAAEIILAAYPTMEDRDLQRFLAFALSWLIEEQPGPVWDGHDVIEAGDDPFVDVERPDFDQYATVAQGHIAAMMVEQGLTENSVVAEGNVHQISVLCRRLIERLERGDHPDRVEKARMLFEATTGVDCRRFFTSDGRLNRGVATAIVEQFLESDAAERFEPGVRYFFGHRVPD